MACCRLCDHFPGVPIVIRLGNRFCLRYTALRTLPLLDAGLHAGRLRCGEPRAEFVIRLGNRFCLRHTALCTLPLLDAVCHAGWLRRSKPCAEFVTQRRHCDGVSFRTAVITDKTGVSRSSTGREYAVINNPIMIRWRGGHFIPLVACTAIRSLHAGLCAGRFFTRNNFPRSKAVGHGRVSLISASHPTDGTFQYIVSSPQAGWRFLIGLYNVFMMFRITVFRRARKCGNRGQRRHERKYQKYQNQSQ